MGVPHFTIIISTTELVKWWSKIREIITHWGVTFHHSSILSPDHKPLALSLYSLGYSYNIILASPIMWVDKLPHFTIIISTADYYFTTPIIVICIHDGQFFIRELILTTSNLFHTYSTHQGKHCSTNTKGNDRCDVPVKFPNLSNQF